MRTEILCKAVKAKAIQLFDHKDIPSGVVNHKGFNSGDYLVETECGIRALIPQEFFKKFFQTIEVPDVKYSSEHLSGQIVGNEFWK
jgi:hypothetical protein